MPKAPDPVPLILRERLQIDLQAVQMSLVGIFHSRRFSSFPTPPQRFTVYAALHGGEGQGTMRLTVARAATEETVYQVEKWRGFADPDLMTTYEEILTSCVFPGAGRYIITLRFDGAIVAQRVLDILQE
jgi:hypothetical protein